MSSTRMPKLTTHFPTRPPSKIALYEQLQEILPDFGDAEIFEDIEESEVGLHTVMRHLCEHVSCSDDLSMRSLERLANLLNEAVSVDDLLENATSTCFLEHSHQIGRYRALAPFLTPVARKKCSA